MKVLSQSFLFYAAGLKDAITTDRRSASHGHIARLFVDGEPYGSLTRDDILDNITLSWLRRTRVCLQLDSIRNSRRGFIHDLNISVRLPLAFSLKRSTKIRGVGRSAPTTISSISTPSRKAGSLPPGSSRNSSQKRFARASDHFGQAWRSRQLDLERGLGSCFRPKHNLTAFPR